MSMQIVLVYPEIPQNTGNIARTCAATGAELHLIEPLGFSLADRYLKRAGLDYWQLMKYHVYPDLETFFRGLQPDLLEKRYDSCIRIPMRKEARSLNLSNSAAIVLYEALRQQRFNGLQTAGELTGREEASGPWLDYV